MGISLPQRQAIPLAAIKGNNMNNQEIINTIKSANVELSAKGISKIGKVDADSAELIRITDKCWEMVSDGLLIAFDRREDIKGALFFGIASK